MSISLKYISILPLLILASIAPSGCTPKSSPPTKESVNTEAATFILKSPAFTNNQSLPSHFACGGAGVSPPFALSNLPENTKTVAFILEDPDAPEGTFTHWIMWNWPASKIDIPAALPAQAKLDSGAIQGAGSSGKIGYTPPCPPSGTHRYYFKAYALDVALQLPSSSTKGALLAAMKGHIVGQGMLMGKYHK